jgi:ABC-2 type transport system ATP-binding protein
MSISAGNRQKLAIARSLLVKNPILFLDEPTVKLDAKGAEAVRELVQKINREFGTTIILTTHYIFEAEELCGRVAIMRHGEIKSCDTVENLRRNLRRYDEVIINGRGFNTQLTADIEALPFVVSCNENENRLTIQILNLKSHLNEILKLLLDRGVQINEIETNEPALEEIFADTIGDKI